MTPVEPFLTRRGTPVPQGHSLRLSIDPGRKGTGWALWSAFEAELLACGLHEPPCEGVTRVVVEMPQTYPNSPVPYQDLVGLAFLAGRYIGRCQANSGPVDAVWVYPHAWKGNLPKSVCEGRIRKRLSAAELKIVENCERLVPKGLMNNVFDAVGIGLYAYRGGLK